MSIINDELAFSVWQHKYAAPGETHPDEMHSRLADEIAKAEVKYIKNETGFFSNFKNPKLSTYGRHRQPLTYDRIFSLFKDFKYIVPQGSIMSMLGRKDKIGSLSNCFVVGQPEDSYGGIMFKDQELAQLMKRRGGVGLDISTLRPKQTLVTNAAGSSTGPVSFMDRYSNTTREVAQDGRRGALMLTIDCRHPDVADFVNIKQDRSKVTGANISVNLRDDFMKAVQNDEDYILRFPCNLDINHINHEQESRDINNWPYNELIELSIGYIKKIRARELYNQIVHNAWDNAEPGQMFVDRHWDYSPDSVYPQYKGVTTNPCFSYDTQILTAEGYLPIGSLEDEVIDFINKDGQIVGGTVTKSGEKPIYELNLSRKTKIKTTTNHRFMLVDGSDKEAQHLKRGDRLMPYYTINKEINEFTKLGFIQGDGSLGRLASEEHLGLEVHIGEKDKDLCDLFAVQGPGKHYLRGYNEILKELGFSSKSLPERVLPIGIEDWSEHNILMFLKGLWSANGCVISGSRVSFKSTCKTLIEQLEELLSNFGIKSYYTTNKAKAVEFSNGNYLCKESYDLNICRYTSVIKFAELIGFVHKYKQDALENLIKSNAPKFLSAQIKGVEDVYDFTLYDDTHWGVVEGVVAHNCGEIFMQPYDACRLLALNYSSFIVHPYTPQAYINYPKLYEMAYEQQRIADDIVDLEISHIDRIITKIMSDPESEEVKRNELEMWKKIKAVASAGRRTGCGFTALGDALAMLGLKYDSDEALAVIEELGRTKLRGELDCSIDLAILRGTFKGWNSDKEFIFRQELLAEGHNAFYDMLVKEFPDQALRMDKFGRRNISWSTVAPTGTVSLMTQTSSGLEPIFMPYYIRRRKINPNEENIRVDFTDQNGDNWMEYPVLHPEFKKWITTATDFDFQSKYQSIEHIPKDVLQSYFELSPWVGSTANDIDWLRRIEIQSVIQKYVSHSISSTINLPNNVTQEEVAKIYMYAWEKQLKGVTIYRDGCRSGVLVSDNSAQEEAWMPHDAPRRPDSLPVEIHSTISKGVKWNVFVGMYQDRPYEVFAIPYFTNESNLDLVKRKKGRYDLLKGQEVYSENITSEMNDEQEVITRLVSTSLRHGADITFIVEQLNKSHGDITSFSKAIARVLAKYVNVEKMVGRSVCEDCGSTNIIFEEGCSKCKQCGSSKCG